MTQGENDSVWSAASADMRSPRRALLLVNPSSGQGGRGVAAAANLLRARGIDLIEGRCAAARDVSPCIIAHRREIDAIVVAGGDGTINAAGRGLVDSGLPLGVLPAGTANDFARSIGIPQDLEAAAHVIAEGFRHRIDVGEVNGHVFFNVASVGIAADLARSLTRDTKRRFGRFGYALSAMRVLTRARPFHATLMLEDARVRVRTFQIAVGNGRFYGGGNIVVSDARIDDGYLDLYSLEFSQVWRIALLARSFKQGAHGAMREVRTARGGAFEVLTRRPKPVNADGELVTQTPARFTQQRGAVQVFVPSSAATISATP